MKSVLVLRHAKSSWKHPDLTDHDRPLNKRGKHDAPSMGRLLKGDDLVPDIIISSTAIRASATAEAVAKASGYKGEIIMNESLYAAGPEAYLDVMHDLIHNPGLVPTCSLAHINLRVDKWLETDYEIRGQLEEMWLPRDLT